MRARGPPFSPIGHHITSSDVSNRGLVLPMLVNGANGTTRARGIWPGPPRSRGAFGQRRRFRHRGTRGGSDQSRAVRCASPTLNLQFKNQSHRRRAQRRVHVPIRLARYHRTVSVYRSESPLSTLTGRSAIKRCCTALPAANSQRRTARSRHYNKPRRVNADPQAGIVRTRPSTGGGTEWRRFESRSQG